MANPFDDLIPGGAAPKGGAFDDLIPAKPPRSALSRGVGLGAQGITDAVADFLGMPVDLTAAGLRAIPRMAGQAARAVQGERADVDQGRQPVPTAPIGGSQTFRDVFDYVGTAPGRVVDAIDQGSLGPMTEPRTARLTAQDGVERFAYGAGRGIGGAATSFVPAGLIAQAAPVGSVTQAVAQTLAARPAMQTVAGAVGGGVGEATKDPWLGMAAGVGTAAGTDLVRGLARRAITPAMRLTPDEQRIAAAAQARGIDLTPGQATGSRTLEGLEATMRRLPLAGNMAERGYDQQRQALNREILATAGVTANRAGPAVIDDAYRAAGQRYDALIQQQGGVRTDPQFANDVARVVQQYGRRLETDVAPVFRSYVDDLAPLVQASQQPGANPQIAADVYQRIRSDITTRARQTKNTALQDALIGLRDTLDDAAARTRPDLAPEWQEIRRQYANLSTIDKAMRGAGGAEAAKGDIPLAGFRNAVRGNDPQGFARGRGDLNELAQIAGFLQNRVPNSGTPERLAMTGLLAGGAAFEPTTAALALGIPAAAQAAYSSAPVRQMLSTRPAPMMQGTGGVVEALMLQQLRDQLGGALAPR